MKNYPGIIWLTLILMTLACPAQAIVLPVIQDATVSTAYKNAPNGAAQKLTVDNKQSSILSFSTASLAGAVSGSQVAKATLYLWVNHNNHVNNQIDKLDFYSFPKHRLFWRH